jgi:hypothetical protein
MALTLAASPLPAAWSEADIFLLPLTFAPFFPCGGFFFFSATPTTAADAQFTKYDIKLILLLIN